MVKNKFFAGILKVNDENSRIRSQRHESADPDPDPPQNVMDPQHCFHAIRPVTFMLRPATSSYVDQPLSRY
jgi:hypothetical protein